MDRHYSQERRQLDRLHRIYKPACLLVDGREKPALLRDISSFGAGLETNQRFGIGEAIQYRWADEQFRMGKVIWSHCNRIGIENVDELNSISSSTKTYRSVRFKGEAPVSVFADGRRYEGELVNLAQRGVCVVSTASLRRGVLATVQIGKHSLESLTARWSSGNKTGFSLPRSLKIENMAAILEGK
ncbi:hypothetical protein E3U23_00780 [Erythrobacter litoralis]|uniref:hypothetical protein n=1 Tax=Erythrobacter litoralis TaxID=39960 RepID=UPI0024359479|nr:hypothetical protein [Erythrobacter litoralis]MDG6077734.1 hypothetical protein [Erythrobacter litoralis]